MADWFGIRKLNERLACELLILNLQVPLPGNWLET